MSSRHKGMKRQFIPDFSEDDDIRYFSIPNKRPEHEHVTTLNLIQNKQESLSVEIMNVFQQNKQTDSQYQLRQNLRSCLQTIFIQVFPKCSLHLVGSSSNGFGSSTADADMCLMLTDDTICQRTESINLLRLIQRSMRELSFAYFPFVIRAKVPILRFTDRISGLSVDLNLNNPAGIQNTRLIKAFSTKDIRVQPLGIVIKLWAKSNKINDASQQTLSSYSLIMMTLHFLQYVCNPPVIPVLDVDDDTTWLNDWDSANHEPLGVLFVKFLRYYSETFNYDRSVISVRLGQVLSRVPNKYPRSQGNLFCIEEPFELTNVARGVHNVDRFKEIKVVFQRSLKMILRYRSLSCIMPLKT
ncbi:hypothetical protein GJ496_002836 [Pomphorhynchus laevis]|nr:hypothetical protein GJ496_002836 [Pomphorhynchus laevis]